WSARTWPWPLGVLLRTSCSGSDLSERFWTGLCYWTLPSAGVRSLALRLLDDLFRDVLRDLGVGVELHRVHRTARGLRPQVANVAEHPRQRNVRAELLDAGGVVHRLNLTASGAADADQVAHVLAGRAGFTAQQAIDNDGIRLTSRRNKRH